MLTLRQERGDTLVEVAIALAILAAVLMSAFFLASKALRLQQTAKERSQASNLQQGQAEALRNFRDNATYATMVSNPAMAVSAPDPCRTDPSDSSCTQFYLEQSGSNWTVKPGKLQIGLFTMSLVRTEVTPSQSRFDFLTKWENIGGGQPNVTRLTTYLVDTSGIPTLDN